MKIAVITGAVSGIANAVAKKITKRWLQNYCIR